jgi:hypothetical protein
LFRNSGLRWDKTIQRILTIKNASRDANPPAHMIPVAFVAQAS